jgi:hypothetical protein
MKPIIIAMLTAGTTLAGYTVYQTNPSQFAPLATRIQTMLPAFQSPTYQDQAPASSYQTASGQVVRVQAPTSQVASGTTYVELLNPHVQAAFAPLEAGRGKLSEEPLQQLHEWFLREREREEARQAIAILDRLLVVMREREHFRDRMDNGAGTFSDEFFKERTRQEWLARSRELAPLFDREWVAFAAMGARFRERFVIHHHDREFFEAIRREEFRPRYGEHPGTGFVFARNEWERHYPIEDRRNPLVEHHTPLDRPFEHHNPLEEHHNPLDRGAYHNPLETNARPEIGHAPEHHTPLERPVEYHNPLEGGGRPAEYHNPLEGGGRPVEAGRVVHGPTGGAVGTGGTVTSVHPTTTAPHPVVVRPSTTVVAPVTAAGGA